MQPKKGRDILLPLGKNSVSEIQTLVLVLDVRSQTSTALHCLSCCNISNIGKFLHCSKIPGLYVQCLWPELM